MGWTPPPLVDTTFPPMPITITGGKTATAIPEGYNYLVLAPPSGGTLPVPQLLNVIGETTGIRWAFQAFMGTYRPLVVPINPAADAVYAINEIDGSAATLGPVYAMSDPPSLPPAVQQPASAYVNNYSGNTPEAVLSAGPDDTTSVVLRGVSWRIGEADAGGSSPIVHVYANTLQSGVTLLASLYATAGASSVGTVGTGSIDFGERGLPLQTVFVTSTDILYFVGNSSSTAASFVSVSAVFENG